MGVRGDKALNTSQEQCVPEWESNQPVEALDAQIVGGCSSLKVEWHVLQTARKKKVDDLILILLM